MGPFKAMRATDATQRTQQIQRKKRRLYPYVLANTSLASATCTFRCVLFYVACVFQLRQKVYASAIGVEL